MWSGIIFTQVGDPVALGLVTNLARPNGNITGFTSFDYAIGGKWLQALQECAPGLARVAVFFELGNPSSIQYVTAIEAAASSVGVGLVPSPVQSESEIEQSFASGNRCRHRDPGRGRRTGSTGSWLTSTGPELGTATVDDARVPVDFLGAQIKAELLAIRARAMALKLRGDAKNVGFRPIRQLKRQRAGSTAPEIIIQK